VRRARDPGQDDRATRRAARYLVKATLANGKIEGSLQDVTEKSRATEDLNFLANNDPLTKVLNRRGIEKPSRRPRPSRPGQGHSRWPTSTWTVSS
jgi:hypothetical protein